MNKTQEETKAEDRAGYIERRMESAYIQCPCCGKRLQLYLVSDEEKGIVYEPMPDDRPGKVYLMHEDH